MRIATHSLNHLLERRRLADYDSLDGVARGRTGKLKSGVASLAAAVDRAQSNAEIKIDAQLQIFTCEADQRPNRTTQCYVLNISEHLFADEW